MMVLNGEKNTKYIKTDYIDRYIGKSNRQKTISKETLSELHKSENRELRPLKIAIKVQKFFIMIKITKINLIILNYPQYNEKNKKNHL